MSQVLNARYDYYSALADYGIKHEFAHAEATRDDLVDFDPIEGLVVENSAIDGKGLFTARQYKHGAILASCLTSDGKKTIVGRYCNHSPEPNAEFRIVQSRMMAVTLRDLAAGEEVLIDYRTSLALHLKQSEIAKVDERAGYCLPDRIIHDLLFNPDHSEAFTLAERVYCFEEQVKKLPQQELELEHELIEGLYRRKLKFPANTMATGSYHSKAHMDVLLEGEMLVATPNGFAHIKAPATFTTLPGSKKAGMALTDTVWLSYHATNAETLEEAAAEVYEENPQLITQEAAK